MAELVLHRGEGAPELPPALARLLCRLGASVLEAEGFATARADLTLVGDQPMRALNRRHRGKDAPTDVLSFPLWEPDDLAAWRDGRPLPGLPPGATLHLGDVVIDVAEARRAAERYGHSLERELGFLLVHGLLHLLGYDHATPAEEARMQARTEEHLARFGLGRDGAVPPDPAPEAGSGTGGAGSDRGGEGGAP